MLAVFKGVEIDPFKPFDFEGVGELFRNFWGTAGMRDGKPVPYNILQNLGDFTGYFWQVISKLKASYRQVDILVDILDKQLIFQLIYPKKGSLI